MHFLNTHTHTHSTAQQLIPESRPPLSSFASCLYPMQPFSSSALLIGSFHRVQHHLASAAWAYPHAWLHVSLQKESSWQYHHHSFWQDAQPILTWLVLQISRCQAPRIMHRVPHLFFAATPAQRRLHHKYILEFTSHGRGVPVHLIL